MTPAAAPSIPTDPSSPLTAPSSPPPPHVLIEYEHQETPATTASASSPSPLTAPAGPHSTACANGSAVRHRLGKNATQGPIKYVHMTVPPHQISARIAPATKPNTQIPQSTSRSKANEHRRQTL